MDFSTKARLARFQAQARKQDPTFYRHGRPAYQAPIRRVTTKARHSNRKQTVIDCLIVLAFIVTTALILFVGTSSPAGLWL